MTKDEGLAVVVALLFMGVLVFYLFKRIKAMQQHLDRLDKNVYECVSEGLFRIEQSSRRELERNVEAMQEHLGLMIVKEPPRTVVVKKGNAT